MLPLFTYTETLAALHLAEGGAMLRGQRLILLVNEEHELPLGANATHQPFIVTSRCVRARPRARSKDDRDE
jgi:hypothetical protein